MKRVVILDVCSGNLRSVQRALLAANDIVIQAGGLAHEVVVARDAKAIATADALVVPGQGAFGTFRATMDEAGLEEPLLAYVASGKPYFGICLGMQILFHTSEEQGRHRGLGIIDGTVKKMAPRGIGGAPRKVPHVGWNQVMWCGGRVGALATHPLVDRMANGEHFYFVHSYCAEIANTDAERVTLAACDYDGAFCAAVTTRNVAGVQFHPEKSHVAGLRLLANFLRWRP